MREKIQRLLDTEISIPVYIFMIASILTGVIAVLALADPDTLNSPFSRHLILRYDYWAWGLLFISLTGFVGLYIKKPITLEVGCFAACMLWIFACASYIQAALFVPLMIIGLNFVFFYAYVYLASKLDILRRTALIDVRHRWTSKKTVITEMSMETPTNTE